MQTIAISIWAMLVASVLPLMTAALAKVLGRFKLSDNNYPRIFQQNLEGIAARAQAAQQNAYETLPVFLAAVLTAEYMVVPQPVINEVAWIYVALRVLYTLFYISNLATLRSIIWTLGFACPLALFYFSATSGSY